MEFNELKKILTTNSKCFHSVYPTISAENTVANIIEDIDNAILNNIDTISEIDKSYRNSINCLLDFSIEAALSGKLNDKEKELLSAISLLLENANNLYENLFDKNFLLNVLTILLETQRSLEDNLILNTFMYNKLKSISNAGTANISLSEKYLTEYRNFLKNKTHDDNYSPNHCN